MADLLKDILTNTYKTTLGTDEVIVCPSSEKVTYAEILPDLSIKEYVEPTICFTKWAKEESLTLSYPDTQFSDKTLVDGELQLSAGNWLWVDISAVSGTPTLCVVTLTSTIP